MINRKRTCIYTEIMHIYEIDAHLFLCILMSVYTDFHGVGPRTILIDRLFDASAVSPATV